MASSAALAAAWPQFRGDAALSGASPSALPATLKVLWTYEAGEAIDAILTEAPGNGAAIGGVKVIAGHGWFAARPSGTEDVYKLYAESFVGEEHLRAIQREAQELLTRVLSH